MIIVSELAQKYFHNLLQKQPCGTNIKVYIKYPGTPIATCGVSYFYKNEITELDISFKMKKFIIYINKSHLVFLKELKIDICVEENQSQLTLMAPYAKQCSFSVDNLLKDKVKHFLEININPKLLVHGGHVRLVNITKSGYVSLKFFGGCNGCSMVGNTLKEGIEKEMIKKFPELKGVYDATQHVSGVHSYY